METVTWLDLGTYLLIYSFLGWVVEAGYYAAAQRKLYNRGFFSLPLLPSYGATSVLLIVALPSLEGNRLLQLVATLIFTAVVESLSNLMMTRLSATVDLGAERERLFSGSGRGFCNSLVVGGCCYLVYLVFQPLLMGALLLVPPLVKKVALFVVAVLAVLDFGAVFYAIRSGASSAYPENSRRDRLARRISEGIWRRLYKAYPGIQEMETVEGERCTFARGLCLDKLIWVFLISAFLGDIIETVYCRMVSGQWMSRSSVLYGPFSVVWGLGAVVLTITLRRLADKSDRYVFLGGFVVGGAYEYLCSVFTELVFGTVFWDYSHMPLNIGGRTNVLFCFFWGVLALVWIKILYPPMSRTIERVPPVAGTVLTWVAVAFMVCNAALTCGAMLRYDTRAARPEPVNGFEAFLDRQYGDDYMERRWPNMRVVESP